MNRLSRLKIRKMVRDALVKDKEESIMSLQKKEKMAGEQAQKARKKRDEHHKQGKEQESKMCEKMYIAYLQAEEYYSDALSLKLESETTASLGDVEVNKAKKIMKSY